MSALNAADELRKLKKQMAELSKLWLKAAAMTKRIANKAANKDDKQTALMFTILGLTYEANSMRLDAAVSGDEIPFSQELREFQAMRDRE
jgi:hypothetical protein